MPPSFLPAALLHDCPFFILNEKGKKGKPGKEEAGSTNVPPADVYL